jgi:nucleoid DNA-binding protein
MITSSLLRALLEENTVTITGLGTFAVKKLSAQIKDEVIFPPQNSIVFEYSKEVEGFDFVSKLSKWEQIRIDEAQTKILEWLHLLEKGLNDNKSIFFDDFGAFSKNEIGKIVFQGVINYQLNIENEGFEPVIASVKDKRIVLAKKAKKREKRWFLLIIIVAVAVLCVVFIKNLIPNFYKTVFAKKEQIVAVKDTVVEEIAYFDPIKVNETHEEITISSFENDNNSNDIYLPYQEGKYYVIAGSFVKEEDALRHIKYKKLEKYNAKLIAQPQSKRLRVCIGVFDNEKDAERFAAPIDKNYWILK